MTRKEALAELIAKVEAGASTRTEIEVAAILAVGADQRCIDVGSAFIGSLDAAKALHEAVLPGCRWGVGDTRAGVYINGSYCSEIVETNNPARAWLLAILRALHSMEADT